MRRVSDRWQHGRRAFPGEDACDALATDGNMDDEPFQGLVALSTLTDSELRHIDADVRIDSTLPPSALLRAPQPGPPAQCLCLR